MCLYPGIKQDISWSAVETGHGLVGFQQAQVAEATYIKNCTMILWRAKRIVEKGFMKRWHQRCTLPACGYVSATEIADDGDLCQLCEQCGVANLEGEAARGLMTNSLSMTADGAYLARRQLDRKSVV